MLLIYLIFQEYFRIFLKVGQQKYEKKAKE